MVTEVSLLLGAQNLQMLRSKWWRFHSTICISHSLQVLHGADFCALALFSDAPYGGEALGSFFQWSAFHDLLVRSLEDLVRKQNTIPFEPFVLTISMFLHGREQSR